LRYQKLHQRVSGDGDFISGGMGFAEVRVEVEEDCASRCHARVGCVIGPEHRYPDDELAYHHRRALLAMRAWYDTHLRPKK